MWRWRNLLFSVLAFCFFVSIAAATPPTAITLTYIKEKSILHVEIEHVTHNPRNHYIRRLEVYQNNNEPIVFNYPTQRDRSTVIEDVALSAQTGDTIRVVAICSKAGRKEETLVVP